MSSYVCVGICHVLSLHIHATVPYWNSHFFLAELMSQLQRISKFFNCSWDNFRFSSKKSSETLFFACTSCYLCSCLMLQRFLYMLKVQLFYIPTYIGACKNSFFSLVERILPAAITLGRERMASKPSAA